MPSPLPTAEFPHSHTDDLWHSNTCHALALEAERNGGFIRCSCHFEFAPSGKTVLQVPLASDADTELQAIAAIVFVLEKHGNLDVDAKARVAEYVNQRYGAFNLAP